MRKLTLHKPALDDYVDVEKDLNENYRKIEEWANSSGTELDNKFDDGGVSTDYDTAKKMEDKIKFLATQIEKTPIGTILPFASGTIPKDYLLCDGREITKNDYSELYDILPFGGYIDEKVFRGLAKNEVPNMTGPTLNGYTITESSVFSATFPGWKAFDSVISGDNGGWASLTGQKEGWVQIQYPNKRALSSFTIKTRTYAPGSKLEKISVYGVTTTSEEELFTENLSRAFTTNEKREFKVNFNKKTYDKFKIKVSAPNDQYCAIDEIELFTVDITQFPNHKQETTKKYLPDLRGQFLRGIKDGRKLLDWESEDIKKHNHKEPLAYPPESSVTNTLKEYTEVREKKTIFQTLMLDDNVNDNVYGRPIAKETYEGNETRPSNIGVNYIIKAKNGMDKNYTQEYIESLSNELRKKVEEIINNGSNDFKKEIETFLDNSSDEAILQLTKKFKEEADKQLGILAGAGSAFKPKQVANIEILKNVNAKVDEVYEVLGYYRFDDGANHKRKISNEDDGSGVQLVNGLWANILHDGELHVEWFGTIGDGRNEQPIFSKISKYIKNLNTNGLKLIFPKGKVFEYGDQVENDKHSSTTPFYKTTNGIIVESKANFDIEIDLNSCTFNKKEGCRFGSFNPLTGEKHPSSGTFLKSEYQTHAPSFLTLSGMNNVKVANGTVDGKRETDIIGGTWGDVGWQLRHYGFYITDIKESIILDNLIIVNQNTDAIVAGGLGIDSYKHTLITNTRINNCGRQGITLSGGKNMFLDNVTITNIGIKTPTTEVASNPKAGIDIENHTSYPINNFSITNSHIENCGNNCIVNDAGGEYHQIKFGKIINCKLINKNSSTLWLRGSEFEMYNSVIVGKILYFQKNNKNGGRIQSCYITDDPSEYSLLGDNTPQDSDTTLLDNSINLYNCTINLKKENRAYFDWYSINYYDCIFSSVSDLEVLGKIIGSNFDKSKKRIFGEIYSRFMETFSFVLHTEIYKEKSTPTKIIKYPITPNFNANRGDIVLANDILSNGRFGRICSVGGNGANIPTTLKLSGTSGSNIFTAKADKNGDKIAYISCSNLFYGIASIKNIKYLRKEEELSVYEYTLDKNSTQTLEDAVATAPKAVWKELRYFVENQVSTLNTPYYADKMKEEGVYNDFKTYMDKKIPYDKQQQKQEEQNQLAYQESFKENPNLTYEEFLSMQPMTLNLIASEEPQPSEALKKFMEKYL